MKKRIVFLSAFAGLLCFLSFMGTACKKEDPELAPVKEALHYIHGDNQSIPQDISKGVEMLRDLAENGNAMAGYELGIAYKDGEYGIMRNNAAAIKYLTLSAGKEYPPALYELGVAYIEGKIAKKDVEKGLQYLEQAIQKQDKQAYVYVIYLADEGDPRAQCLYADWLRSGVKGVCDADPERAMQYYQASAKQGYAKSSNTYLQMLIQNLEDDYTKFAVKLFATTSSASLPLSDEVNLELVKIQGGVLTKNSKKLILTHNFAMGKYEVTQKEFTAVMGYNPSWFKGDDRPVEQVDWREAMKFCQKLTERFQDELPDGYCFSLPSSAQWEFAACGGTKNANFLYSGSNEPDEVAWYGDNASNKTHPAGQKKPNELGLYDMSGNVWEWCRDGYVLGGLKTNINPESPDSVENRIYRGGSWCNAADFSKNTNINYFAPKNRFSYLGFRVAMVPAGRDMANLSIPLAKE